MPEEIRRPGVYGVNKSPAGAPPAAPLPAPPLPAPPLQTVPLDLNSPEDQLAQSLIVTGTVSNVDDARKKAAEWLALSPAERWQRNVKEANLTEAEAQGIQDSMLQHGYWEKEYVLYNGKLRVVFRSRDAQANQRVADALDACRTNDMQVHQQARLRVQLACSLCKFNERLLPFPAADKDTMVHNQAFMERRDFCDRCIPGPALDAVYRALIDFDAKTYAAMSEGAAAGF